jgi:hypothetical protein
MRPALSHGLSTKGCWKGSFGEAVRDARQRTRAQHGGTNTWAAYQCYGNRLPPLSARANDSDGQAARRFYSRSEFFKGRSRPGTRPKRQRRALASARRPQ